MKVSNPSIGRWGRGGACFSACVACVLLLLSGCSIAPQPISEQEHWERAAADRSELFLGQDRPAAPITLYEAVARALKYNMDHRLAKMEMVYGMSQFDSASLQMLPRLALNGGYVVRNNESASSSISYQTRKQTLEPSVSSDIQRITGDISFSWSILDFGLGYFQARQQANRYLISAERRRRIVNNMVKEVVSAYWRVASLESINPAVEKAIREADEALKVLRRMEDSRTGPVVQTLEQQRSLINVIAQLRLLSSDLAVSRARLAALMNIPLADHYEIVPPGEIAFAAPVLTVDLADLERIGVYLRPDLREESYQARIDRDEVKKEMLRMIPGLSALGTSNYDHNSFLVNNLWAEAGARATMDLLGLAGRYKQLQSTKTQAEVSKTRRLAGTVAAMVQINMSYHQYRQAQNSFEDAKNLNRIENKLLELTQNAASVKSVGRLDHIMQSTANVNSRLETDRRMVEILSAWANLYFSIGGDILPDITGDEELPVLVRAAEDGLKRWMHGDLPPLPEAGAYASIAADGRADRRSTAEMLSAGR